MSRSTRTLLAIALILAAPAASAGWRTFGSFEPDTPQDVLGGYMHLEPDVDPNPAVGKVYFNVENGYDQTGLTPNVGALGTRLMVEGFQWPHAFLGIWKDCNEDGYIGFGAGALLEYSSLLLLDEPAPVCPVGASAHNDGEWVYEFLWIGPADNVEEARVALPRLLNDTGAFVWGDGGIPGTPRAGGCYVDPPTGTFHTTGAFLGWSDCLAGYAVHDTVAVIDPDGEMGLKWDDRARPHCDDSTLTSIHIGLWGDAPQCPDSDAAVFEENSGAPAFTAFDCSAEPTLVANDPTGATRQAVEDPTNGELSTVFGDDGTVYTNLSDENGDVQRVYAPGVPTLDTEGSYYDGANDTFVATLGSCDEDAALGTVDPEAPVANEQSVQRQTDWAFEFTDDLGRSFSPAEGDLVTDGIPRYGGVTAARTAWLMPIWVGNTLTSNSVLVSGDLQPEGAAFYTFYARLGVTALIDGTPGPVGVYGNEWCLVSPDPAVNGGFDCDADNWWKPEMGANEMPTEFYTERPVGQAPGAEYHLRDIDCYDGTIVAPARAGLADISDEGSCPAVA